MTSLASQLASIKANNNATILDKSRRRKLHGVSLLYDPKEAASQDFETVYYESVEAFRELAALDARFLRFEKSLFSETSIRFDRLVQSRDQDDALNDAIEQFLMLVSQYLHLNIAFRALEWLVRRFQVQVHNVESLLQCTLPWHSTEQFVRILDIIYHQNFPPLFKFLLPCKQTSKGPSTSALVRVLFKDYQLLNAVNAFQLKIVRCEYAYERQLMFFARINCLVIMAHKEQGTQDECADQLLPVISEGLASAPLATYTIFSVLASQLSLSIDVLTAAQETVVRNWTPESQQHALNLLAQLHAAAEFSLPEAVLRILIADVGLPKLVEALVSARDRTDTAHFASKIVLAIVALKDAGLVAPLADLFTLRLSDAAVDALVTYTLENAPFDPVVTAALVRIVEEVESRVSVARIDRLELALQTHINRRVDAADSVDETAATPDLAEPVRAVSVEADASGLPLATHSFIHSLLAHDDLRAQVWVKASAQGSDLDELRRLVRVAPEFELSFALALAVGPWPTVSRCAAIRFCRASLLALIDPAQGGNPAVADFQAILGPLLFLLNDPQRRIRTEAAALLDALALNSAASKTKFESELHLHWLGKSDFATVIKRLRETAAECVLDREYVLTAVRQAGKASLCDFLTSYSHTILPPVLWICLRSLASFKGVAGKLSTLLATWNTKKSRDLWAERCAAFKFPLSGLDKALVGAINSNDDVGVDFLLDMLRTREAPLAQHVAEHVAKCWSSVFRQDTRVKVAKALVDMAVDDSVAADTTETLNALQPIDVDIFLSLLHHPSQTPLFSEATKRRRRRSSSSVQVRNNSLEIIAVAEKHLRRTTVVLELLERRAKSLNHPAKLLFALFDTLEQLMALGADSHLPVLYTEELLANCLILLVEGLKEQGDVKELGTLKVSVVVSCIRTSSSPQVQNRFLLLIAALAGLCPDAVLHGVMPIFTFMGAKTVRLDNDYSAHVIEHTIEQVVPALIAAGDRHEEIETALLSFVAAFPHIPRHRRTRLFSKLVDVLGPEQCLYKLLLLLGQRYADSLDTRRAGDARGVVQFTIPFVRMFDPLLQLRALCESGMFIAESQAEGEDIEEDDTTASEKDADMDVDEESAVDSGDEHDEHASKLRFGLLKIRTALRRSQKLRGLYFEFLAKTVADQNIVSGAQPLRMRLEGIQFEWSQVGSLIDALLKFRDNEPAVQTLLERILEMLPIEIFVESIKPLLDVGSVGTEEYERMLTLVGRRFSFEPADEKAAISCAADVLKRLTDSLEEQPMSTTVEVSEQLVAHFGPHLKASALKLLDALSGRSGLLHTDSEVVLTSILAINTVCQKLGASTFAYFPRIFPVLCEKVRNAQILASSQMAVDGDAEEDDDDDDGALDLAAFALFAGLLRQMPKFVAPELPVILDLVFSSHISASSRQQLLEVVEDKVPADSILPAALSSWSSVVRGGIQSVELFFPFLNRTVAKCTKDELSSEMPHFTRLLIACLSTREQSTDANFVNQVEAKAINATINAVLRLNDQVFRPQFVRVVEWGFSERVDARQVSVLKFVLRVLSQLKSVVTNYIGHILDQVCAVVVGAEYSNSARKLALEVLITSFVHDKSDFWQAPTRFEQVLAALLHNLTTAHVSFGNLVVKAVTALAKISTAQNRKTINDRLAALLGNATPHQKVWCIRVLSSLYKHLGEGWVSNLPQLVPIIAELLDDEDEKVELETRKSLVPVIETVLGESLDRYLA